ncbi:AprI/Inh family metalloprotease inhibitor [Ciceribacter sp. L1K23]|uniref:AprI/Inh family metalloprotease inhibitor n=1 Tax=Ciceribacter sp. L1K23 TaxID=2820276 RepID=UPI001B831BA0|nr:AprI/Inh family metalloprotease inhibitor [Ciceribacter sp. L1K23]MBR0555154.1 AprI/Inh family metalloprotease inhibitor [Ciceribacter sp. L1K23]
MKRLAVRAFAILGLLALLDITAASAQSPQDFVGNWTVEGGPLGACSINLSGQAMGGQLKATTYTCVGPMSFAWAWAPTGNGVTILGTNNFQIATLNVNRGVLTGRMNDGSLVTMKPASGQRIGAPQRQENAGNTRREKCYRRYDNDRCAEDVDVVPPRTGNGPIRAQALNMLNIRGKEDMKSEIIGRIEPGQCFLVESCRETQWGLRCRVPVGDSGQKGYVIKYFSDKTGDYIVFRNRCR